MPNKIYDVTGEDDCTSANYMAAVTMGSEGKVSPLLDGNDWLALRDSCTSWNTDWLIAVAWCWAEGHMGTDPNLAAASVHNFGGIKWANQPGAYDSGIPADTGGTYAGFPDASYYWNELLRTLHNEYIGPAFNAGDLISAAETYTNGPGSGHNKVEIYEELLAKFRSETPVSKTITRLDFYNMGYTQLGQTRSGTYDTYNGDHFWADAATNTFECEAYVESTGRNLGLDIPALPSALDAASHYQLVPVGKKGDILVFGTAFYATYGHTAIQSDDTGDSVLTTAVGGIQIKPWGKNTVGYLGAYRYPGVSDVALDPSADPNIKIFDGPGQTGKRIIYGFKNHWEQNGGLETFGMPVTDELTGVMCEGNIRRTVQYFERAVFEYFPEFAGGPFEVQVRRLGSFAAYAAGYTGVGINPDPTPPPTPTPAPQPEPAPVDPVPTPTPSPVPAPHP